MVDTGTVASERKWPQMGAGERLLSVGKWMVTLVTFGFVFPHSMDPWIKDEPPRK